MVELRNGAFALGFFIFGVLGIALLCTIVAFIPGFGFLWLAYVCARAMRGEHVKRIVLNG